ncbi:MAG: zinc ABC transporter substrate-binding protein [Planctomycetes bacterium]|nr:zinc ABC transporter substrate-binding protein [Planctomycetota bacterium]
MKRIVLGALAAILVFCGVFLLARPRVTPSVVVTTTMLETAARELVGENRELSVVRLLPPGSCPGHFDLSPRMVPVMRTAAVVVRHDYQDVLEEKITALGGGDIRVLTVDTPGSLCIPANYLHLVRQMASVLAGEFPDRADTFRSQAVLLEARMSALSDELQARSAPFAGRSVIASFHQKQFCEWLGLDVIGVLARSEEVTPRELEALMALDADAVVANLQEGLQAATALAERMRLPLVVFSNFPGVEDYGTSYDDLLRADLDRLESAWLKQ